MVEDEVDEEEDDEVWLHFRVENAFLFFSDAFAQQDDDEAMEEIDPTAIKGRRTRGLKVDYTSKEALEKAGLTPKDVDEDDDDEMKEN